MKNEAMAEMTELIAEAIAEIMLPMVDCCVLVEGLVDENRSATSSVYIDLAGGAEFEERST